MASGVLRTGSWRPITSLSRRGGGRRRRSGRGPGWRAPAGATRIPRAATTPRAVQAPIDDEVHDHTVGDRPFYLSRKREAVRSRDGHSAQRGRHVHGRIVPLQFREGSRECQAVRQPRGEIARRNVRPPRTPRAYAHQIHMPQALKQVFAVYGLGDEFARTGQAAPRKVGDARVPGKLAVSSLAKRLVRGRRKRRNRRSPFAPGVPIPGNRAVPSRGHCGTRGSRAGRRPPAAARPRERPGDSSPTR